MFAIKGADDYIFSSLLIVTRRMRSSRKENPHQFILSLIYRSFIIIVKDRLTNYIMVLSSDLLFGILLQPHLHPYFFLCQTTDFSNEIFNVFDQ